jgi:FMN-dependent NADH-azoreductase
MQTILYISCSPRGAASHSLAFAEEVLERLRQHRPGATVITRDLATHPADVVDAAFSNAVLDPASPKHLFVQSETLIAELEQADVVLIATPMHNFTVPAALKAWIDQVVRINRTFTSTPSGKVGTLADRPVFVVIASGGWFSGPSPTGTPAQPDFLTPYLRTILNTIGIRTIHILSLEGVTRGPAMLERAVSLARQALDRVLPRVDPGIPQG